MLIKLIANHLFLLIIIIKFEWNEKKNTWQTIHEIINQINAWQMYESDVNKLLSH